MFGRNKLGTIGDYIFELIGGKSLDGGEVCINKVLCTGSVSYNEFNGNDFKYLPVSYVPDPKHQVVDGDVLVSRMNTLELVGAAAYVGKAPVNTYVPDRIWRARVRDGVNPVFVWQLLIQPMIKNEISKRAGGTSGSMKNISKPKLLSIPAPIADRAEQDIFSLFVEKIDKSKYRNLRKNMLK